MKFILSKTSHTSTDAEKEEYEKLGFKFGKDKCKDFLFDPYRPWVVTNEPTIEVNSLDELLDFISKLDLPNGVILSGSTNEAWEIEIYDSHVE